MRESVPLWKRVEEGIGAVVEKGRRDNGVQKACSKDSA